MSQYSRKYTRKLRKIGIRHFDKLIHDQPKEWLIKNFSHRADEYPVNVAMLFRNIIWQMKERIRSGDKPPFKELIRTFWYMYIKPTLTRADALSHEWDQYKYLVGTMVDMVKKHDIIRYKDIGFRDENQAFRRVGRNPNIIVFSEKTSEWDFLTDIADKYNISILALGNQPSVLTVEYFVDEVKKTGINLKSSFYLFSIVDYDTSGWIIKDAFVDDLKFYGIKNIHMRDLVTPDMLTKRELELAKYEIRSSEVMESKNKNWVKELKKRNYRNQKYLVDKEKIFGLESQAVSAKRLSREIEDKMVPLLGKKEDFLKVYELKILNKVLDKLILHKVKQR